MKKNNLRAQFFLFLLRLEGSKIPKHLKTIENWQNLGSKELNQIQEEKLKKLLLYSYKHVPHYRKVFKKNKLIKNGEVDLSKFSQLPILDRKTLRQKKEKIHSDEASLRGAYKNTSGGTSGEPVVLLQDKNYRDWNFANKILANRRLGKRIGDREIKLWGSERDIFNESESLKDRLVNFLYNRATLNSFKMSRKNMFFYVKKINDFKPLSIWAYVDSIFELAKFIKDENISVHAPKFIMTTAGVLTERVRAYVEDVFQTKVVDQYGSRELGIIAAEELDQNGLRVFPWSHYLEVEKEKLLVTSLDNYSMPLIRYELGDLAELMNIDGELRIKQIFGRHTDHFVLKDGTLVHGEYFTHLFYFQNWVQKFRVEQENFDEISCIVVLNGKNSPPKKDLLSVEEKIKLVMGKNCKINWQFKKNIKNSKSGKYIYTYSKVKL